MEVEVVRQNWSPEMTTDFDYLVRVQVEHMVLLLIVVIVMELHMHKAARSLVVAGMQAGHMQEEDNNNFVDNIHMEMAVQDKHIVAPQSAMDTLGMELEQEVALLVVGHTVVDEDIHSSLATN